MSIYKRVNDKKNDLDSFVKIIDYITKKPYTHRDENVGVIGCRKDSIIQDMTAVKKAFHKEEGKNYQHAVLSITPDLPTMKDSDYMNIGRRVASHCIGYQCAYALHKDTKTRHLHFVWNNVSYKDGKRFSQGPPGLNQEKMYINSVLEEYDLDPIRSSPMEIVDTGDYDIKNPRFFLEINNDYPDDRNMFLAPPPKTEEKNNTNDEFSYTGAFSNWYGNFGGNDMYNNNFIPAAVPQSTPAVTQASTIAAGDTAGGNGLNLVNINNITLESQNDLGQAVADLNDSFRNSAHIGAEALATLRQRGVNEGVTITNVNNFFVESSGDTISNPFGIIDIPYND